MTVFGWNVAISGNKNIFAVGAPYKGISTDTEPDHGIVRVYELSQPQTYYYTVTRHLDSENNNSPFFKFNNSKPDDLTDVLRPGDTMILYLSDNSSCDIELSWDLYGNHPSYTNGYTKTGSDGVDGQITYTFNDGFTAHYVDKQGDSQFYISVVDRNANSNDVFDGSSYIYCALRTCTQIGNDISGNSQQYDEFGYSIKLSNDGKVIVIGAPQSYGAENSTPTSASQIGYVEVYKYAENSNLENISKPSTLL